LWCSWLIERGNISVYFPGDTAIGPHFAEVRQAVGAANRSCDDADRAKGASGYDEGCSS
jgi:L-ascorbate metabolism protein UlaG (beta-lactamase superfamily)